MSVKILVVDDESAIRFAIKEYLIAQHFEVLLAENCGEVEQLCQRELPDLAIVDYRLPDGNALELLARLKMLDPDIPVLILTAHGSIDLAVTAIKEGAENFLTKPVELESLLVVIRRALENRRNRKTQRADLALRGRRTFDPFVGKSPSISKLKQLAHKVAASDSPVLIQGETGAGKGVLASWLHQNSLRRDEVFVDLSCAGFSKEFLESELFGHEKGSFTGATSNKTGLFEIAHRGTVFLDEIGDMDLQVQPRLLKVLEEKRFRKLGGVQDHQVDIRLIAATNQDLNILVEKQKFRSDLFFRINTIVLTLPALRERTEDLPILADTMLQVFGSNAKDRKPRTLSDDARQSLLQYSWPGNIRELRNVLERAVLLSEKPLLEKEDLFGGSPAQCSAAHQDDSLKLTDQERQHIEKVLRMENYHVARAAEKLDLPKSSLYQKIKKYNIALTPK